MGERRQRRDERLKIKEPRGCEMQPRARESRKWNADCPGQDVDGHDRAMFLGLSVAFIGIMFYVDGVQ